MTDPIYDSLKSDSLDVVALTDPARIEAFSQSVADQINTARSAVTPAMRAVDLSGHIADIIIETAAQGASLLEVHVIDPNLALFQRDSRGTCFIDADEDGYLWPPIEINFPEGKSDSTWRLAQVQFSLDTTTANVTLVFEDKIVAELREHSGPEMSNPNETRAEFIRRMVKKASQNPLVKGDVGIRFIPLLPTSAFTAADLTADEATVPASAKQPNPPPARKNPNKTPGASKPAPTLNLGKAVGNALGSTTETIVNGISEITLAGTTPAGTAPGPLGNPVHIPTGGS